MANQKYSQVASMAGSGQLNWRGDHIVGMLMQFVAFNPAHTHTSDLVGAARIATAEIGGRQMGVGGEALGLPAAFPRVAKNTPFQVLVVKDVGDSNPMLLAFFDQDAASGPLQMVNNGTLIVRPTTFPEASPPQLGVWFTI
jgi:hypothetical protein